MELFYILLILLIFLTGIYFILRYYWRKYKVQILIASAKLFFNQMSKSTEKDFHAESSDKKNLFCIKFKRQSGGFYNIFTAFNAKDRTKYQGVRVYALSFGGEYQEITQPPGIPYNFTPHQLGFKSFKVNSPQADFVVSGDELISSHF